MPVDSGVLVEALVLGGDERVLHDLRNLVDLDEGSPLEPELGDEATVYRVKLGRLMRRILGEDFNRRALIAATDEGPTRVNGADAGRNEKGKREQHHSDECRMALAKGQFAVRDLAGRRSRGRGHCGTSKITVIHRR